MALPEDRFLRARITYRREVSPDLWIIRVDPGGDFDFVAGQYATLGIRTPEKLIERAYSIVSSPYEKELEIFIELVPHGDMTPLLYQLQAGAELTLRKIAKGRFTLDLRSGHRNHFLLCTVTGVAPYLSYLRTLYRDWKQQNMPADIRLFLIDGASRSFEFGYLDELRSLAAEVPWFRFVPTVSRPWEDPSWQGEIGRTDDLIRKYCDLWELSVADTTAYLCGHPQMIETGMRILERKGFDKKSLKQEVYWVPVKGSES